MKHAVYRILLALTIFALLWSCNSRVLERQADQIRKQNARLDAISKSALIRQLKSRWLIRGNKWFGVTPDGKLVCLVSPRVFVEPVHKGKPFCCGWAGYITIVADQWESEPPRVNEQPFTVKYQAVMIRSGIYDITTVSGMVISPAKPQEITALDASKISGL